MQMQMWVIFESYTQGPAPQFLTPGLHGSLSHESADSLQQATVLRYTVMLDVGRTHVRERSWPTVVT